MNAPGNGYVQSLRDLSGLTYFLRDPMCSLVNERQRSKIHFFAHL